MKRCWFGLGLLVALLIAGLLVAWTMARRHENLAARLDRASDAAAAEDWDRAEAEFAAARQEWEDNWHTTAAFADHGPMEDMDGLLAEAESYLRSRDPEALAAVCAQLARMAEALGEAHTLNWWNLL